jgi:hypothetical protein
METKDYWIIALSLCLTLSSLYIYASNQTVNAVIEDNKGLCILLNAETDLTNSCVELLNNITGANISESIYYEPCRAFLP